MDTTEIISALHKLGAIQFGRYEIKRNFVAPFQVDLTSIISEPDTARRVCQALWEKARKFEFDLICGIPSIGTLLAGFISWEYAFPMVTKRLDGKEGLQILGKFKSGQKCLVLHDVLGFGGDVLNFIDDLEAEGLSVVDTVALIDLELGGKKRIKERGMTPHHVIGMKEVIQDLFDRGKIPGDALKLSTDFLETI